MIVVVFFFFFSSRRRHTRFDCDWSSDVCSSDLQHCFIKLGDDGADRIAIEVGQRSGPGLTGRERRSEEHQRGEQPTHEHRTSVDGTGLNTTPGIGPRNRGRCVDSRRALLELLFATGLFVLNRDLALTQLLILLRLLRARPLLLPWSRPRPVVPSKLLLRLE